MIVEVDEHGIIELKKVFVGVKLITADGEEISIVMRDTGFEFIYEGVQYSAKKGTLKEGL